MVVDDAKFVATFRAIARNPHNRVVNEARSIPLSLGFRESNEDQFFISVNVHITVFEENN